MTQLLLKEKLLPLARLPARVREQFSGVVRIIDVRGQTRGIFLDREAMENLLEEIEYASPAFREELDDSRVSGTVTAKTIEKRLGISR